jgi:PAS domain S-box-containing protein
LSLEETTGKGWQSTVHPEDLQQHLKKWGASMSTGERFENELRHRNAKGEYRWFLVRAVPLQHEHGNILKWYGVLTDIEDRKRAEALLAGEKRILEMVAKGDSLAQILDSLCRLVEELASDVLTSMLLVDGDRLRHGGAPSLPKAYTDAIDGVVIGPSVGSCGTAAYRGEQVIVEDIASDPLWADYRAAALPHSLRACWSTPIFSTEGKVIATFAMYYREPRKPDLRDREIIEQITHLAGVAIERKLTQEALRRSESYLTEAQRLSKTGSWAWSPTTQKTLYWSEEMFRIFAFDPKQGVPSTETFFQRIHPEDRDGMFERMVKAGNEKTEYVHDHRIVLPDGTVKHIHAIGHPVLAAGEAVEFVGTSVDITERKRAEELLRESEGRFRTSVDHLTDALFIHDDQDEGTIIDVNQQACDSLGYTREELIGMRAFDYDPCLTAAFNRSIKERLARGEIVSFESIHRRKDGTEFPVELRARPFWHGDRRFGLALARGISDRKRAEAERERLRQLETDLARINRVSMLGELTASLAHEIKQPIAAAVSNAEACLQWLARDQPDLAEVREAATETVKEARRAAEIMTRVRSLFQKEETVRSLLDVNEVIRETVSLVREEADRNVIRVRTDLDTGLPKISCDRVQMQQVLMNLMLNGIEAMRDSKGELIISSQRDEAGKPLISVTDAGVGLPAGEKGKIFDAFFTTKAQGTGMGLAISRSIIESHGGRLWASANSGQGTTFHFTLPTEVAEAA